MMASLATLLVDFVGTQYYERKQGLARPSEDQVRVGSDDSGLESGIVPAQAKDWNGTVFGEEEGGGMHIVGMHAHAAHHRHSHPQDACDGHVKEPAHDLAHAHAHAHAHSHGLGETDEDNGVRHVVVSQVFIFVFPSFLFFLFYMNKQFRFLFYHKVKAVILPRTCRAF